MKKHTSLKSKFNSAFSLVELLVVIAVIAVIAAIAIPNIAGITGAAGTARDQRNAQNLASVFNSAVAAGYPTVPADEEAAINAITSLGPITVGTQTFSVDGISAADIARARTNLGYVSTPTPRLVYVPTGTGL